ncbi:MAG: hypothetical protein KC550_00400 [Nanoarchaeota archaeon]|nr:hypothetical protein [Nanoarchaeota archaeon]
MIGTNMARILVGNYFEEHFARRLNLVEVDREKFEINIDLSSRKGDFFLESKGSAYDNGAVIREKQLFRYINSGLNIHYGIGFHSHSCKRRMPMKRYKSEKILRKNLDVRGMYVFPIEVISAFYLCRNKIQGGKLRDSFVLLKESMVKKILLGDEMIWDSLNLESSLFQVQMENDVCKLLRIRNKF